MKCMNQGLVFVYVYSMRFTSIDVKMPICDLLCINHSFSAFLVLRKNAVKSMNDHNLSILSSISMKLHCGWRYPRSAL